MEEDSISQFLCLSFMYTLLHCVSASYPGVPASGLGDCLSASSVYLLFLSRRDHFIFESFPCIFCAGKPFSTVPLTTLKKAV